MGRGASRASRLGENATIRQRRSLSGKELRLAAHEGQMIRRTQDRYRVWLR